MIKITDSIEINEDELQFKALYSSGPGGQHVNKNMTAVQLRFDIIHCHSLPHDVQQRLIHLGGARVNQDFQLVITSRCHRSQERNKREAIDRLCLLIKKAAKRPVPRKKKRRSHAENQNRLDQKKRRGEKKSMRRKVSIPSD